MRGSFVGSRWSRSSVATAGACSTAPMWAAGDSSWKRACGIAAAIASPWAGGIASSSLPEMTSVGAAMRGRSLRRSIAAIAAQASA